MLQAACDVFCVGDDVNIEKANNSLISNDRSWKRSKFRLTYVAEAPELTQGMETGSCWRALGMGRVEEMYWTRAGAKGPNLNLTCVKFPAFQSCRSTPLHAQGAVCDGLGPLRPVPVCICNRDVGL